VDHIFEILSAPSADEHKMTLEANLGNSQLRRMGRRMSQAARRVSAAVGAAAAAKARNTIYQRKKSTLILEETTRVVPDNVMHNHALAQSALGQSLLEAFAKRQTSLADCTIVSRAPSRVGESDVESGIARNSRHLQRVHGIVNTAMSFSDDLKGTSFHAITPAVSSDVLTGEDEQNLLAQLSRDIQAEYDILPSGEQKDFADAWSWDPERKNFTTKNDSLCSILCCKKNGISDQAVSEELHAVKDEYEEKMENLKIATDMHVGEEFKCVIWVMF
jgi:hypothetical protein